MPSREEIDAKVELAEREMDYKGMREFQGKFIAADHALRASGLRVKELERERNDAQDYTSCVEHKIMDHYDGKLVSIGKVLEDKESAESRVKELSEALRWIPVEERLPEDGVRTYCAFTTHAGAQLHMHILIYRDGDFRGADSQPRAVSHWMPLPAAPGARAVLSEGEKR